MPNIPVSPELIQRLITLIRRDLKLAPSVHITEDMPLVGSDMDLDSLDILLLVTNLEKEFGIKVGSQEVGHEPFRTVRTLAEFVAAKLGGAKPPAAGAPQASTDLLGQLPHREPFLFVSAITSIEGGVSGEGEWRVSGHEAFFTGHFPGEPLVPGVLIAEALAQFSGLVGASAMAAASGARPRGKLAHVDVRFTESVVPPAQIILRSRLTRTLGALQQFEVAALCKGAAVASGSLTIAYETAAEVKI